MVCSESVVIAEVAVFLLAVGVELGMIIQLNGGNGSWGEMISILFVCAIFMFIGFSLAFALIAEDEDTPIVVSSGVRVE